MKQEKPTIHSIHIIDFTYITKHSQNNIKMCGLSILGISTTDCNSIDPINNLRQKQIVGISYFTATESKNQVHRIIFAFLFDALIFSIIHKYINGKHKFSIEGKTAADEI